MGKYEPSPQMQAIYTLRGEVNRLQKELDIITEERNELRRKVVALRDNLVTEQQKQLDESARDAEALNAAVKVLARILTTMDKG